MNLQYAKIYKIVNLENGRTYFGSTCERLLCNRMSKHRASKRRFNREMGDLSVCKIYLVEEYPCLDIKYLRKRERYYIENFPCINKNIPSRTNKEWYQDNKEIISLKQKIKRLEKKIEELTRPPSASPEVQEVEGDSP